MKMKVTARWWNGDFEKTFGCPGAIYDFPDATKEFVEFTQPFGRFEIEGLKDKNVPEIEFQNDYD